MHLKVSSTHTIERKTEGSACFDVPVAEDFIIDTGEFKNVKLDIAMDIPEGYCVLLFPRSSTFAVHNLIAPVSVIDSDYKKQVHGLLYNPTSKIKRYKAGDRLFQGMLVPVEPYDIVGSVVEDTTGRGGLGSTGR